MAFRWRNGVSLAADDCPYQQKKKEKKTRQSWTPRTKNSGSVHELCFPQNGVMFDLRIFNIVISLKETVYPQREHIISFIRSPLDFKYGDFTKGNSLLTEGADYFIYEKPPPPWTFNMVTSLMESAYSQKEQIISFMRSPPGF